MKESNKEEYNKLCAEFLGAVEYVPKAWYYFSRYRRHWFFPSRFEPNRFTTKMLRFDSDWNWIMEVVEKIEQLGFDVNIFEHDATIKKGSEYVVVTHASKIKTKKEAVVQAIWKFLNWYKKNK